MAMLSLVLLPCVIFSAILVYFKWSYSYWKRKGLPYIEPTIPTGNLRINFKSNETPSNFCRRIYAENKAKGHKHIGLYMLTSPQYMPLDTEIIRHILYDDFNHFVDRGLYYNEKDNPLSAHIVALDGNKWRYCRKKLTPVFTSMRIKMMFNIVRECNQQLNHYVDKHYEAGPIDIKSAIDYLVINVISSSAFGFDCNAFEDTSNDVVQNLSKALSLKRFEWCKLTFGTFLPELARLLHVDFMSKDVANFFHSLFKDTVNYRKTNNVSRDDFMQLLITLMDQNDFTLDEVAAHAFAFFVAGFESMTHTCALGLYQMCHNVDVQMQLREEVCRVVASADGEVTYDNLSEMKYLDQVVLETLRMYPPLPTINRKCVKKYQVPNTNLIIDKGTFVVVPLAGLHYDPDYFPNPDKFDPSRFIDSSNIKQCTFMPFGDGPRNCIGQRFGTQMVKAVLANLVKNYEFSLCDKTALKFRSLTVSLKLEEGLFLNVNKL